MSFNQLPDELVAQMASYLNIRDMAALLQTQKRIENILKRNKLHRRKIDVLNVTFDYINNRARKIQTFTIPEQNFSFSQEHLVVVIKKFPSISSLTIFEKEDAELSLDEYFLQTLIATRTKIGKITFGKVRIGLSSDNFVMLCKRFKEVRIIDIVGVNASLLCDNVICDILTTTLIDFRFNYTGGRDIFLNITDRTLEAISAKESDSLLHLSGLRTDITINGIRRYVENIIGKKRGMSLHLGTLNRAEELRVMEWRHEIARNDLIRYELSRKRDINGKLVFTVQQQNDWQDWIVSFDIE